MRVGILMVAASMAFIVPSAHAQRGGYSIVGDSSGGWSAVLDAVGFRAAPLATAAIIVVRPGPDAGSHDWPALARDGAYVIVEGASPTANRFGFTPTGDTVTVRREVDDRYTGQMILWEIPQPVSRVTIPEGARVFSHDRWSNAPLLVGRRIGKGAVLWAAIGPGRTGFARLPYVAQALADLGLMPPVVARRLQVFVDYAYRTRADPAYLAATWRRMGVARIFVSSWYFLEADTTRDRYLASLIDAAHRNNITVYAWLELPHVSQHFWEQHPEWREQNGLLQDALVDWRKNMNLLNDESFASASALVTRLLRKFDWDGANLSELYFEGTRGLAVPADMTPFNADVRREVRTRYGFDPGSLFDPGSADYHVRKPERMRQFQDYRADLQRRLHERWLDALDVVRHDKGSFGLTVCYVDDISEPRMRDLIGADVRALAPVLQAHGATLLVQDPFVLWGLGPSRYTRIAAEFRPLLPRERVAVDINIVARKILTFPTRHQTGTELFQLVHTGQREFSAVSLYAENSILSPDIALLPFAAASVDVFETRADGSVTIDSRHGVGIRWTGEARVDGAVWPFVSGGFVFVPSGRHVISPSTATPSMRIIDFTGDIDEIAVSAGKLMIRYRSDARAIVTLANAPGVVLVDGDRTPVSTLAGKDGRTTVLLPAGIHRVELGPARP